MAKTVLNTALSTLRGHVDGFVYKHYANDKRGLVVSRKPDMSGVKWSPAQRARRELMRKAGQFHRDVLKNPGPLKKYQRIAKREGLSLSAATMREALRKK